MLDFNRRKRILRKLSDTAEKNVILLIPCLAAAGLIKLFYFIVCNIDIALSDKDGNFLGIKSHEKHSRTRKDDIVYVKRGFMPRAVSLVLSFAFVMMFVPTVFPSIESSAAGWSYTSTEDSKFVNIDDDTNSLFDINIPFDSFKNPEITGVTGITAESCVIQWNFDNYFSNTGGTALPSMFIYKASQSVSRTKSDGIIENIELWAFVTKDGQTQFKQMDIGSTYNKLDYDKIKNLKNSSLPGEIKVNGLDPEAEYKFVLCANQQWVAYNLKDFVPAKTLGENNTVPDTSDAALVKTSYAAKYKQTAYIDSNGDGSIVVSPDDGAELLYNEGTDVQTYYPGQYTETTDKTTSTKTTVYKPIKGKENISLNRTRGSVYIPHYSNIYSISTRTLDNVKTMAIYSHNEQSGEDTVQLKLGSDAPEKTRGYLVYRSENSATDKTYKLIAKVDVDGADDIIYTDTTRTGVEPSTEYLYYLVPVTWTDGSGVSSTADHNDSTKGKFITGTIPGSGTNTGIKDNSAKVYTDTGVPQNFTLTQNGVEFVLTWNAVKNATGYILEREYKYDTDPTPTREQYKNLGGNVTTFTDSKIAYDTDYTYYLTAVNQNNTNNPNSNPPAEVSGRLSVDALTDPHTIQGTPGDNYATLTWMCSDKKAVGFDIQYIKTETLKELTKNVWKKAVDDIVANHPDDNWDPDQEKQLEYIKENYSGEYSKIYNAYIDDLFTDNADEISQNVEEVAVKGQANMYSYTIHNLTPDTDYSFRVRSYVLTTDPANPNSVVKRPASKYQPYPDGFVLNISTPFAPPNNVKAVTSNGNITVTWDPVDTATGYEITIRKCDSKGNILSTTIENVTGTKYELTDLRAGDIYMFTVKGTKRVSGQTELKKTKESNPAFALVGNPILKVTDLKAVLVNDVVELTWTAAQGDFTGYYLYITNNGSTIRKDLTDNKYTHSDVKYGQTYSYYVVPYRAVILSDGTTQYYEGDRSNVETITIGGTVGTPDGLKATPGDRQIFLDWNDVKDASGYVVYVTSSGKTETYYVTASEFLHTGLTPGQTYSYYVVAYKNINNVPVYGSPSVTVSAVPGGGVDTPLDFSVTTNENSAILSWTKVKGATGYTVYGSSDSGKRLETDVSKNSYVHKGLTEGEVWSYYVVAYKLDNGQKISSAPTKTITVTIGASYPPPSDLVATPGNRTIVLTWSKTKGVDGYIVYVYDENTGDFQPLSIVSKPAYQHTGLKNGKKYTYMVAGYKFVNGVRVIGDYSLAVSAIPTSGNAADVDYTINIRGTAPYGISHSELISAAANHEAFDDPVDAYFSVNDESTRAVKEVLRKYANGLKSFIVYPFDISLYLENTLVEVEPNEGFNITFTVPVPDVMKDYRDYITVVHLKDDGTDIIDDTVSDNIFVQATDLEVLPSAIVDVGGVWCIQFTTSSCSPFAFVVYKDNLEDVTSGSGTAGTGGYSGSFNTGVLLITALPDMLPIEKKTKFVERTKKRYRIKK